MIEYIVKEANALLGQAVDAGTADARMVATVQEINQRYIDYLDELSDHIARHGIANDGIIVKVDGASIKFKTIEDVAEWMTSL